MSFFLLISLLTVILDLILQWRIQSAPAAQDDSPLPDRGAAETEVAEPAAQSPTSGSEAAEPAAQSPASETEAAEPAAQSPALEVAALVLPPSRMIASSLQVGCVLTRDGKYLVASIRSMHGQLNVCIKYANLAEMDARVLFSGYNKGDSAFKLPFTIFNVAIPRGLKSEINVNDGLFVRKMEAVVSARSVGETDANNTNRVSMPLELPSIQIELPSIQMQSPPPQPQVSASPTLSCQVQRIRKRWSKDAGNLIGIFGQHKSSIGNYTRAQYDEKENRIKEKRELRADFLERRKNKVRDLRWARKAHLNQGFLAKYKILNPIGEGGFGAVYEAKLRNNLSFGPFAVKIISKSKISTARREIRILKKLYGNNANIVRFYEAYEDANQMYLVTELCKGGNLYERLQSRGGICGEREAKRWIVQVLNAVAFCHSRGIIHRDIKPENFMCATKDKNSKIKLIDFGLSASLLPGAQLGDVVGTPQYMAPEVFKRSSGFESEAWSVGVMTYEMLVGECPFATQLTNKGVRVDFSTGPDFSSPVWRSLSSEAVDFVKKLLNPDPNQRMTIHEAQRHKWINSSISGQVRHAGSASSSGQVRHAGSASSSGQARHAGPPASTSRPLPPIAVLQERLADLQNLYRTNHNNKYRTNLP